MEEVRNTYKILVRKPEGQRTCMRPRQGWDDNIKMDLIEGVKGVDWIQLYRAMK
jgi:hypothetical protein